MNTNLKISDELAYPNSNIDACKDVRRRQFSFGDVAYAEFIYLPSTTDIVIKVQEIEALKALVEIIDKEPS